VREVKFRAWCDGLNQFFYVGDSVSIMLADTGNKIQLWCSDGVYDELNADVLQEYTGLTDKNGKEIYEGDLICLDGDKDMICACRWNVKFGCFDLYFSDVNDLSDGIDIWGNIGAEIIGNIYENKEVLDA